MPNHCENDLRITGDKKELSRFKEFAKGIDPFDKDKEEVLSCHKFIPAPKKAIEDYSNFGYDWCIKNWGTKWGIYDTEMQYLNNEELFYTFQSAWSPPLPVIKKMGEMFPELKFDLRYFEQGMGFNGMYRVEKGKVTDNKSGEYFGDRGG